MPDMIAIDASALDRVFDRLDSLERKLDAVRLAPAPKWIPAAEYAQRVGRTEATIRRWVRQGKIESRGGLVWNPDA